MVVAAFLKSMLHIKHVEGQVYEIVRWLVLNGGAMKRIFLVLLAAGMFCVFTTGSAWAQEKVEWKGTMGWGVDSKYQKHYNYQNRLIIQGKVEKIGTVIPLPGMSYGIYARIKGEKHTHMVHLGPGYYIEHLDTKIEAGDRLIVTGVKAVIDGKDAIIAIEIGKGERVLRLRGKRGVPIWSGTTVPSVTLNIPFMTETSNPSVHSAEPPDAAL